MHWHLSLTFPSRLLFQVVQLVRAAITAAVPHKYARAERLLVAVVILTCSLVIGGFVSFLTPLALQALSCKLPCALPHKVRRSREEGDYLYLKRFGLTVWAPVGKQPLPSTLSSGGL